MRRILLVVVAFAAVATAVPARAQTCTPFTDVGASDPFCANIQWMFNRGVTQGCTASQFCPGQFVRRDQMAAFMNRLADKTVFQQGGNAFGAEGILGTSEDQPLDIRVNDSRVMRYEPHPISPNVIGGHPANGVTPGVYGATIAGGGVALGDSDPNFTLEAPNTVTDAYGFVGGGYNNVAGDFTGGPLTAAFATVAGGLNNTAGHFGSTVSGGDNNNAVGAASAIAGGQMNSASGFASFVAGGQRNTSSGNSSLAAGAFADANANGCFVWGDFVNSFDRVRCDGVNRFVVRARGGIFMWAGGTSAGGHVGVQLQPGNAAWTAFSDRRMKENFRTVDTRDVLERLVALPISTWNLKSQDPSVRHMGVMAQDFRAAFGLGATEVGIDTLDADGVAMAAIQGLDAKLEAKIAERDLRIADQAREIADLRRAVQLLLARLGAQPPSLAAR
ncbi:MAG: hypothetical protein BroJett026_01380 [Betaproteobacteria bacterium]|nr:MAG: hypothetical protein BroJett026_01380 [Betaproteobacteria bacterium]